MTSFSVINEFFSGSFKALLALKYEAYHDIYVRTVLLTDGGNIIFIPAYSQTSDAVVLRKMAGDWYVSNCWYIKA